MINMKIINTILIGLLILGLISGCSQPVEESDDTNAVADEEVIDDLGTDIEETDINIEDDSFDDIIGDLDDLDY